MSNKLRIAFWLTLGLSLGSALGLYLGWVAWPTEFTNADPALLGPSYQQDYILMVATGYSLDQDLAAASRRLDSLGENGRDLLFQQMLDTILLGQDETAIRHLVQLAYDMGLRSPAMRPYLPAGALDEGT